MADDKPIIVIKKKGGHAGHHGGAWKVAFADFMTAMMCFFLVMWLVGTADVATKKNIATYFRQPGLFDQGSGSPLMIGETGILKDAYVPPHPSELNKHRGKGEDPHQAKGGTDLEEADKSITIRAPENAEYLNSLENGTPPPDEITFKQAGPISDLGANSEMTGGQAAEAQKLQALAADIKQRIQNIPELEDQLGDLEVKLEANGLVIEVMDREDASMFASSSARILPQAEQAFMKIATLLNDLPNEIDIIGHTDAQPFASRAGGYSNWELSSDRANAARRVLEQAGITSSRILSVVGRSDRDLRNKAEPLNAENRRISLKVRFNRDLSVDAEELPTALERIDQFRADQQAAAAPPVPTIEKPDLEPSVEPTTYIPSISRKKKTITLPEGAPPTENPAPALPDLIFGEAPVFGPASPFSP